MLQEDPYAPPGGASPAIVGRGACIPGTPYRVCRRLEHGAKGEILEAEHVDTGRCVAIKLLHPHAYGYQWRAEAFRREALAAARTGSPHIVDVSDTAELPDGRPMIVMERLHGVTVRERLERGAMDGGKAVDIARQIALGLAAAHEAGLVHLDLEPNKVMLVRRDGCQDFVVLLGFGAAQLPSSGHLRRARSGHAMATAVPERDARADVHAVGQLLYAMVCGAPAFTDERPGAPVVPPSERVSGLSRRFDAVVMRCLQPDPAERFQTMAALEAALAKLPELPGPPRWSTLPARALAAFRSLGKRRDQLRPA